MQQLYETFNILKKYFGDDEDATKIIEEETQLANEWITENSIEESDTEPRIMGKIEIIEQSLGTRSIFDDIDTWIFLKKLTDQGAYDLPLHFH